MVSPRRCPQVARQVEEKEGRHHPSHHGHGDGHRLEHKERSGVSYEAPGASKAPPGPRAETEEAVERYKAGFVWNALKKGIRIGFFASSDHISFACVYAEAPTGEDIIERMKRHHTYAATGKIVFEYRLNGAFMGETVKTSSLPRLKVKIIGTDTISQHHNPREEERRVRMGGHKPHPRKGGLVLHSGEAG